MSLSSLPRLKVALATRAPFVGGAEVAAERLALGLQEAGHEVFLLLGQAGAVQERLVQAGLRCLVTPLYLTDKWHWWRDLQAARQLRRVLRQERPDLLHSNDLPTHQMVSRVAGQLKIPRICHHRFPFEGPALDWFNKYGAERHLFVSRALMEDLCSRSSRLQDSSRGVLYDGLVLPGIPTDQERRQARERLGLPGDRVIVTIAGQIIERKGVADLLRAWSFLGEQKARAELYLIGDDLQGQGAYRIQMEQLAKELSCAAHFAGFQKNVPEWLVASDLAVVPSHVEPLGNATLEAMAHALPVLGCAVGGIPEMIVHDQTGLLIPPRSPEQLAEALARLLGDRDLRIRLGQEGHRRCEELFSLRAHTEAALAEYARLIPQPVRTSLV
jgi:glycosyltransferase involved in cell wall biosynthesis